MEPKFVFLLKNLRGLVYFSKGVDASEEIKILKKSFRYRTIGILKELDGKYFFPIQLDFLNKFGLEEKAILTSSFFATPLLILSRKSLKKLRKFVIESIGIGEKLEYKELKRNLRLVNYSITDFYVKSIELFEKGKLKERVELAKKDTKRFWRLKRGRKVFIVYLEPAKIKSKNLPINCFSIVPGIIIDKDYLKA